MKHSGALKFFAFLAFIVLFAIIGQYIDFDPEKSRNFFAQFPMLLSGIIFIVLYVVSTFFIWFGPKDVLRVASLFIFGVMGSTVVVYVGEMLNMCTMFWFSRRMGRPFVKQRMKGRLHNMDEQMSHTSTPAIFFMKFYPIIPFRFLDLTYGLTKISFSRYALITLIAAPIRLYVIQYFMDVLIRFGITAVKGDFMLLVERFMEVTNYFLSRPIEFFAIEGYTISGIIFFITLMVRQGRRKRIPAQAQDSE